MVESAVGIRVLVLGGYGLFGRHVCIGLRRIAIAEVWLAGRSKEKAEHCIDELKRLPGISEQMPEQRWIALAMDHQSPDFVAHLVALQVHLVIHCAGPFQAQNYHVAQAAIACGANYIDLADGREFVAGIAALNDAARIAGVCVLSGGSSVPAISSAVVTQLAQGFAQLHSIDVGISPGNRTERGLATVTAILSYVGEQIPGWRGGQKILRRGWLGARRFRYPSPALTRFLVDCDVPDLALFPTHYLGVREIRFGAGLEHPLLHFGLYALAWLRRLHLMPNLARIAKPMQRASEWFQNYGSNAGAMHVQISGIDADGNERHALWTLVATEGCGPHVPATPAVAFAARLAAATPLACGARPCVAEFTLSELQALWQGMPICCQQSGALTA